MGGVRYIWKIENFSCMKSGTIHNSYHPNNRIIINPFASSECIGVEITRKHEGKYYSKISIALLDSEGSPLLWREKEILSKYEVIQFNDIKRDTIFGSMRDTFLPNDTMIVQCLLWDTREELLNPQSYFMYSRIELHSEEVEKTFRWNIANISSLETDQTETRVELFTSEGDAMLSTGRGDELTIRLFLGASLSVKLSGPFPGVHVKCIISMLDMKGKIIKFAEEKYDFPEMDEVWTFDMLLTKDMLEHYRNVFLPNDTLSLIFSCTFCAMHISSSEYFKEDELFVKNSLPSVAFPLTHSTSKKSDEPRSRQQNLYNSTISQALMGILEEGFLPDFNFRVQDKTFSVHKIILSARSSVFRAMFTADMKEKQSSSVDIPDVEADTFQRMLKFIYSDSFENDMQWESASKLYSVADKYALEPLKQKCSLLLKSGMRVSSVLEVLLLGDMHQDGDLKAAALNFVARKDKEIIPTERWGRFLEEHPKLALDTFQKLYTKKMSC